MKPDRWPFIRDIITFFGGFAGVLHETTLGGAERPALLAMFAVMMGLPAYFAAKNDSKGSDD